MDTDYQQHTIKRDGDRDIKIKGEIVGEAASREETGRWAELTLYRTAGGRYVCQQIGRTIWEGEHDRHSAAVCYTTEEVVGFFGVGWLAKQIYDSAGIDAAEEVE